MVTLKYFHSIELSLFQVSIHTTYAKFNTIHAITDLFVQLTAK